MDFAQLYNCKWERVLHAFDITLSIDRFIRLFLPNLPILAEDSVQINIFEIQILFNELIQVQSKIHSIK